MRHDRYLKFILTIIAVELLWLGLKDAAPGVAAQAPPAPARVVVAGVEIDGVPGAFLPVAVAGSYRDVPRGAQRLLEPLTTRVAGDVQVQIPRPVKVEADKPLPVQQVDYTPRARPGE